MWWIAVGIAVESSSATTVGPIKKVSIGNPSSSERSPTSMLQIAPGQLQKPRKCVLKSWVSKSWVVEKCSQVWWIAVGIAVESSSATTVGPIKKVSIGNPSSSERSPTSMLQIAPGQLQKPRICVLKSWVSKSWVGRKM